MTPDDKTSVRVAVRVRPLSARERQDFQSACLTVAAAESQLIIGTERAFTFDHTFNSDTEQEDVYGATTKELVEGCFSGFNATVLAYGQTGSGKTYTMGTAFEVSIPQDNLGIIPRAVDYIFHIIDSKRQESAEQELSPPVYDIEVQFIELYQDEIIDLLDRAIRPHQKKRPKPPRLGEDKNGNVCLFDVCTKSVESREQVMEWLKQGALARTTAATNMNAQSSRSHAIFTIIIKQSIQQIPDESDPSPRYLTTSAKFHFVDLAGSERLKRTKATGDRAKESIAINGGLLALGNVICKLGDKSLKATHIPYRSSKLTRLLQDSLGGNSRTVMIACVSPAEQDFVETLNTLRYANRARNIQNKVTVNQDQTGQAISVLRAKCQQLEMQLLEYQQGKRLPGVDAYNDMFIENSTLQKENESLRQKLKEMAQTAEEKQHRILELRAENERLKETITNGESSSQPRGNLTDVDKIRQHYVQLLEDAQAALKRKDAELERARSTSRTPPGSPHKMFPGSGSKTYRIARAKPNSPAPELNGERVIEGSMMDDDDAEIVGEEDLTDLEDNMLQIDQEIEEKEKRLHELEATVEAQRQNYEAKIQQLSSRIQEVELERSSYLRESQAKKGVNADEVKARDMKYQHELEELRQKLKDMQTLRDENKKLLKSNQSFQYKLTTLENEIGQLRRLKCDIMRKIDKDNKLARQKDIAQTRAINQREKESRSFRKENVDLKRINRQLEQKVIRLRDEVQVARRLQKGGMTDQIAGRVGKRLPDEVAAKNSWDEFMEHFRAVAYKRMRLRKFEKQLHEYGAEMKSLREQAADFEKRIALAAESQDFDAVDSFKSQLADTKATLHYVSQQNTELQNEAASCEETAEEYSYMDPAFLRLKFSDDFANRYFVEHLLDVCYGQHAQIHTLECEASLLKDQYSIACKERDKLHALFHAYIMESPNQTKVDIVDAVQSRLDGSALPRSQSDDLRNILTQAPIPLTSSRPKARQILNGPEQMLIGNGLASSSSSTSSGSVNSISGSSDSDSVPLSDAHDGSGAVMKERFRMPLMIPAKRLAKDFKQKNGLFDGSRPVEKHVPQAKSNMATPFKGTPNRSFSYNEIPGAVKNSATKVVASASHSLENLATPGVGPKAHPVRRHPCQNNLNAKTTGATTPVASRR